MDKVLAVLFVGLVIFGIWGAFSALSGFLLMLLWNFAIAPTFNAPALSFWAAWAITILLTFVSNRVVVRNQ